MVLFDARSFTDINEENDNDEARKSAHILVLELLRWARRNKTTDQGMNELLALVQPFLQDGLHNFPGTAQQARRFFSEFMNTLKLRSVEICANGCHRFEEHGALEDEPNCPECQAPRRDVDGTRTTCTYSFFDLKDKLRLFFARPNFVPLLTSHARHEPQPERMYGIHGKSRHISLLQYLLLLNL